MEQRHPVPRRRGRHPIVQPGHEPVRRPPVRQHLERERARDLETPRARPRPRRPAQPLPGVAVLQVVRVEMHGRAGADRQVDRPVARALVVERRDRRRPGGVGMVDDAHEAPHARRRRRREQRHAHRPGGTGGRPGASHLHGTSGRRGPRHGGHEQQAHPRSANPRVQEPTVHCPCQGLPPTLRGNPYSSASGLRKAQVSAGKQAYLRN